MSNEKEILNITLEECAEVIQAISKILRFGWESTHPRDPTYTNADHLNEEVGDLLCMIDIMIEKEMLNSEAIQKALLAKKQKLKIWSNIYDEQV
jgi:NTP pyrophosphatase (non-canonical NTP hydrolase)